MGIVVCCTKIAGFEWRDSPAKDRSFHDAHVPGSGAANTTPVEAAAICPLECTMYVHMDILNKCCKKYLMCLFCAIEPGAIKLIKI